MGDSFNLMTSKIPLICLISYANPLFQPILLHSVFQPLAQKYSVSNIHTSCNVFLNINTCQRWSANTWSSKWGHTQLHLEKGV